MCSMEWCSQRFFNMYCGIRQGGLLSPILFNVYVDELISVLKDIKLGCYVDMYYVGYLLYADDLTLQSASLCELQNM